jgi:steroid 5-alpha reductase family enzyme
MDLSTAVSGLAVIAAAAFATWLASVAKRDVSIVDSMWGVFILLATAAYYIAAPDRSARAALMLTLVAAWALRLSIHITLRNRGHGEDRRYQAIRQRNEPNFAIKSLYLVFGLQALLAWIVSTAAFAAIAGDEPLNPIDYAGAVLFVIGLAYESIADWQLARFKADESNRGRVMNRGLWRYSRHPNYFGEFLVWWGAWLIAAAAGGWWAITSPLLMSVLLLRVSGVTLLEADIHERRPMYAVYQARTNAFFPGPQRMEQVHEAR